MIYSSGYCPYCKKQVKIEKEECHYGLIVMIILGVIITFTLGGLFAFLFVLCWIGFCILNAIGTSLSEWKCTYCGGIVENHSEKPK